MTTYTCIIECQTREKRVIVNNQFHGERFTTREITRPVITYHVGSTTDPKAWLARTRKTRCLKGKTPLQMAVSEVIPVMAFRRGHWSGKTWMPKLDHFDKEAFMDIAFTHRVPIPGFKLVWRLFWRRCDGCNGTGIVEFKHISYSQMDPGDQLCMPEYVRQDAKDAERYRDNKCRQCGGTGGIFYMTEVKT